MDTCWFCSEEARTEPAPGGWLIDDGVWRAGHAPAAYGPPGTVILEARRHVLDPSVFNDVEAATYSHALGRLTAAIRGVTGCDRVYQWATMDRFPHFHVWLIPWWEGPLRGPRFLVARLVDGPGCDPADAERTAALLRADLLRSTS